MFEGVGAMEWLSVIVAAAFGGAIAGSLRTRGWRIAALVLWCLLPGLLGGATSSVGNAGEFLGIALLVLFFVGLPWLSATLLAFGLARMARRARAAPGH